MNAAQIAPAVVPPRPFFRWVGGKTHMLDTLLATIPADWSGRYVAPFLGGGALFWALASSGRLTGATLSDINPVLIGTYRNLQQWPRQLISVLKHHRDHHSEAHYLDIRKRFNDLIRPAGLFKRPAPSEIETSAAFLYLNSVCFNGLYRLNGRGEFNVSMDPGRGPKHILSPEREALLLACYRTLVGIDLRVASFRQAVWVSAIQAGDLVYADSPYIDTYDGYSADGFSDHHHDLLARKLDRCRRGGALVMASNSDCNRVRQLYAHHWHLTEVNRPGTVSAAGKKRQRVGELLITSWAPTQAL